MQKLRLDNLALIKRMAREESYKHLGILKLIIPCRIAVKKGLAIAFVKRMKAI